jgi:hypothetical protein
VTGSDEGAETQIERHVPSLDNPRTDWQREVGNQLVETFTTRDERDVLIIEEVDHRHGFRVEFDPAMHLPPDIKPRAEWEIDSKLTVYETETGKQVHEGTLVAVNCYKGAFRISTPAGEFDTVLIREDFKLKVGPLRAEDDRYLFYAKSVGLVAEIEGLRASAMPIFRIKEKSAKILVEYPGGKDGDLARYN